MGVVDGGTVLVSLVIVRDGNPWVCSHGTHTHEHGYGFHMGVGAGGPKFTHGLPVMSTTHTQRYQFILGK